MIRPGSPLRAPGNSSWDWQRGLEPVTVSALSTVLWLAITGAFVAVAGLLP